MGGESEVWAGESEVWGGESEVWAGESEVWAGESEVWAGESEVWAGESEVWAEVAVGIGLTICAQLSLRSAIPGLSPLLKSNFFSGGISVSDVSDSPS